MRFLCSAQTRLICKAASPSRDPSPHRSPGIAALLRYADDEKGLTLEPNIEREALRLLALREHSRRELQRKLCVRGYAEADVERLIEDLADRNLVSDRRMVETYVAERVRKGFGPLRIRQELRQRGLDEDLIDSCLGQSTGEWWDALSAAHAKRFGPAPADDRKARAQQTRFLEYRGFPAELIADFLNGKDPF